MTSLKLWFSSLFDSMWVFFWNMTFLRFLLVGFSNFAIGFSTFWLIVHSSWQSRAKVGVAQLMCYSVATLWSYYWNRKVTFSSSGDVTGQLSKFVILQVILGGSSSISIGLIAANSEINPSLIWFAVMSIVTVVNFLMMKRWVFRENK